MLGFKSVEQVNEVVVFDAKKNVSLVLQHLHFLGCGYRVLTDEF